MNYTIGSYLRNRTFGTVYVYLGTVDGEEDRAVVVHTEPGSLMAVGEIARVSSNYEVVRRNSDGTFTSDPLPGEFEVGDRIKSDTRQAVVAPNVRGTVVKIWGGGRGVIFDDAPFEVIQENNGWVPKLYVKITD